MGEPNTRLLLMILFGPDQLVADALASTRILHKNVLFQQDRRYRVW